MVRSKLQQTFSSLVCRCAEIGDGKLLLISTLSPRTFRAPLDIFLDPHQQVSLHAGRPWRKRQMDDTARHWVFVLASIWRRPAYKFTVHATTSWEPLSYACTYSMLLRCRDIWLQSVLSRRTPKRRATTDREKDRDEAHGWSSSEPGLGECCKGCGLTASLVFEKNAFSLSIDTVWSPPIRGFGEPS